MRMMMDITFPHEPFNALVKAGTAGETIAKILDSTNATATYFTEQHGHRGCVAVVDVADPSRIPSLAEPWFLTFQADVRFRIVMTGEDLNKSGLDALGKKWA